MGDADRESHENWMLSLYVQSSLGKPFNSRDAVLNYAVFFRWILGSKFLLKAEIVAAHTASAVNFRERIHQHNCKTEAMPGRTDIYNKHNLSQDVCENPNNFHPDSRNIVFVLFHWLYSARRRLVKRKKK